MALKDDPEFVALKSDLLKEVSSAQIAYEKSQTEAATAKATYENSRTEAGAAKQSYETVRSILDTKWDNIRSTVAMLLSVGTLIFAGTFAYQIFKVEEVQKAIAQSDKATSNASIALENISLMYDATSMIIQAKEFMAGSRLIQARETTGEAINILDKVLRRIEEHNKSIQVERNNKTQTSVIFEQSVRKALINAYETHLTTFFFMGDKSNALETAKKMQNVDSYSWKPEFYIAFLNDGVKDKISKYEEAAKKAPKYNKPRFNLTELYFSDEQFSKSVSVGEKALNNYEIFLKSPNLNKVELVLTKLYIEFSSYFKIMKSGNSDNFVIAMDRLKNEYKNIREEVEQLVKDKRYDDRNIKEFFDSKIDIIFNRLIDNNNKELKTTLISHKEYVKRLLGCMLKTLPRGMNVNTFYKDVKRSNFCYGDATPT